MVGLSLMSKNVLIVTCHSTLVEWLKNHGIEGRVVTHATPADVAGKHVYGNGILPLWLAAEADTVTEVYMPGLPLEARSKVNRGDYTIEQMDKWGAEMRHYKIFTPETARCDNQFCSVAYDSDFAKLS